MKTYLSLVGTAFFSLILTVSAFYAQTPVNGGILNGKALNLVKPDYPPAAKTVQAGGAVHVQINIDENGNVISSKAVSGHPLLQKASEEAALKSKFSPTLLGGKPVKVSGILVYNFVSETKIPDLPVSIDEETDKDAVRAGIINSKAVSLPGPNYPAAAKAVKVQGSVSVQVTVDEEGKVIMAKAVSGHPLLRTASENAALLAIFSPTRLNNKPVKVSGIILYNFSASGGNENFLQNKATFLPQPDYPPNADKSKDGGTVRVQVSVDENGNVLDAKAVAGNPVFFEASEQAAREAKFEPTLLNGKAVKVTGIITYNFAPKDK
jgi:TonB family protein